MDVAEEGLLPAVHHRDGPACVKGEHAGVDVDAQVFTAPEGPADSGEHDLHALGREAKAGRDLLPVLVDLLAGNVEVDPAVFCRQRDARLGPQEGLVLGTRLVVAANYEVGLGERPVDVAVADDDVAHDIARGMHQSPLACERYLRVADRVQNLIGDLDGLYRPARLFGLVGGDDGDGLAVVSHLVDGKHGLVCDTNAVGLATGDVLVS